MGTTIKYPQFELPMVCVDDRGWILLRDMQLSQGMAVALALELLKSVEDSVYREQKTTKRYRSTVGIRERSETRLGQAITAVRRVFN